MTEEKKKGWFKRLTQGLSRTSPPLPASLPQVFQQKEALDDAALEELEDLLVESDLGPQIAATIERLGLTPKELLAAAGGSKAKSGGEG